jgi:uncharacterized protein (DUF58 family)
LQADRKSPHKGAGLTFADYSEYSLGDDYRAIDWRVYARFEQLVIKLFEVEEDLSLSLLIDASPSMASKWTYARELAAAIGYIALQNNDRVSVDRFADVSERILEASHGRGRIFPFLRSLENATIFGKDSDLATCAKVLQARTKKRGMVVLISDFLFPEGADAAFKLLQGHGHEVFAIQVQDDGDRRCTWRGDCELDCVESGQRVRVTITPDVAKRYEQAVLDLNDQLRKTCARRGVGLVSTTSAVPFEDIIQGILRRGGLVA